MNAIQQARQAYGPAHHHIRTPRSIEAQAFADITSRLKRAKTDFPSLAAALHANRSLWTLLAADIADADNGLPAALRAQIFYLAEFTDLHSRKVLRGEAGIDALIDINVAVMRGLSGQAVSP